MRRRGREQVGPQRFGRFPRSVSDERLLPHVRSGDPAAFEALYDRYHAPLLAFCRHMLGSREEAEDALQHVFVSAHRALTADDGRVVELRPWLYAIARNRCLSVLRARRDAVALDDVAEPASAAGLAVAAEVERRADLRAVLGDLAALPDEQRAALVLSELGDLSHDEVAAVLEVRREKVKALVFQAREALAARRQARDTDCRAIREQLATLRGGALRRGPLRKHLDVCDGCRGFRDEVRRQREAMVLLLPVVPSLALKAKVMGAVVSAPGLGAAAGAGAGVAGALAAGSGAGGAASSGALGALGSGLVGKGLVVAALAGATGGGYAVVEQGSDRSRGAPDPAPAGRVVSAPAAAPPSATQSQTPAAALPAAPPARAGDGEKGAGRRANRPGAAARSRAPLSGRPASVPGRGDERRATPAPGARRGAAAPARRGGAAPARRNSDPPGAARREGATGSGPPVVQEHGSGKGSDRRATPSRPPRPQKPAKPVAPAVPDAAHGEDDELADGARRGLPPLPGQ